MRSWFKFSQVGSCGALPRCAGCLFLPVLCFACSAVPAQLSVCALRQMNCTGALQHFSNALVQLGSCCSREPGSSTSLGMCSRAGMAVSWSRVLPELNPQWPEQGKAVAPLKDGYDPWPRENTGELILEVCNEKVFLYLLWGNWECFLPMSAFL